MIWLLILIARQRTKQEGPYVGRADRVTGEKAKAIGSVAIKAQLAHTNLSTHDTTERIYGHSVVRTAARHQCNTRQALQQRPMHALIRSRPEYSAALLLCNVHLNNNQKKKVFVFHLLTKGKLLEKDPQM